MPSAPNPGKSDKSDFKSLFRGFCGQVMFCDPMQDAGSIEFAQLAIPRGRTPTPEGDPSMSHALAYLYTLAHVVQGRLELQRLEGRKDRGATAVEYGLLVGLIAVVIIVGVTLLGKNLVALFNSIAAKLAVAP
jgi:pilus assembly protein Flp/PilA